MTDSNTIRTLLIEDEEDFRVFFDRLLRQATDARFVLKGAASLAEGIQALSDERFDVVMLDLGLPDSRGVDTITELRKADPDIPVVVVTGLDDEASLFEAMERGAQDYLLKGHIPVELLSRALRYAIERKQVERALDSERRLLTTLLDNMPDNIYFKDREGRYILVNTAKARRDGLRHPVEATGKTDFDFYQEGYARSALKDEERVMASGTPLVGKEERVVTRDGREMWVSTTKIPIRNNAREIIGTCGISRDITARKAAEDSLRAERNRARMYLDIAGVMMVVLDAEGRVNLLNKKGCAVLGYAPDEVRGKDWFRTFYPEEERERVAERYRRVMAGDLEMLAQNENTLVTRTGERRQIAWQNVPLLDESGQLAGALASGSDVTERRVAEQSLLESEERFRVMFNIAHDLMAITSPEGRTVWANPSWVERLGWIRTDQVDTFARVHPDDHARVSAQWRDMLLGRSAFTNVEYRYQAENGEEVVLETTARKLKDATPHLVFVMARDISQRKREEDKRLKLEAEIQQVQKLESLGLLAGGIAHDFNNLLMGVLGNADLAIEEVGADSPIEPNLQDIIDASRLAAELCKQLLAYSGKGQFVREKINLSKTIDGIRNLLQLSIGRTVECRFQLEEGIPPIEGDSTQIKQVIMNLVSNASDAIGDDQGMVRVGTGVRECDAAWLSECLMGEDLPPGEYACLEIRDTGCGISPETQSKIFDPFFSTKFTGRGLGLAAVMGIVRGHHGTIRLDSRPGEGTTFQVLFPAASGKTEEPEAVPSRDRWQGCGTIILADDEDTVRRVAGRMLERIGFNVLTARDGEEAVGLLREQPDVITAVILDMTMPRMNGAETCSEMRKIRADVPILMSSGYSRQETGVGAEERGVAGFVQKPYRLAGLRESLRRALSTEGDGQ